MQESLKAAAFKLPASAEAEKFGVGDMTLNDIVDELRKPGRDPREDFPKPIMRKGVRRFVNAPVPGAIGVYLTHHVK